jgi:hypothetical protein
MIDETSFGFEVRENSPIIEGDGIHHSLHSEYH